MVLGSERVDTGFVRGEPRVGEAAGARIARAVTAGGSLLAAILASSCCVVPFALFSLGVSGAWIGQLTAFAPYQPYAIALALALLAGGFALVCRKPKDVCAEGSYCARPGWRTAMIGLWTATGLTTTALVFPYLVPLIFPE
jgi:mercuric ion transport protein